MFQIEGIVHPQPADWDVGDEEYVSFDARMASEASSPFGAILGPPGKATEARGGRRRLNGTQEANDRCEDRSESRTVSPQPYTDSGR
jgi:hypothetical protein